MPGIDWSLLRTPDIGGNTMRAFEQGQKMGDELRRRKAIKRFASDPENPEAVNALMEVSPDLGFKAADYQREQAKAKREQEYGSALGDYVTSGGGGALLGVGGSQPSQAAPNALSAFRGLDSNAPRPPGQNALAAFTATQGAWPSPDQAPQLPDSRQESSEPDPDLAILGAPKTGADRAFLRMIKADPMKALKLRSELRDNFVQTLKDTREVYRLGIERLSLANDEPTYQAVLAELQPMTDAIGGNLLDHVPRNYPGPEGIQELLTKALDAKEQVTAFMQQTNIEDDNERADRNTDSLIQDRTARRGEARRNNDLRDRTTRRGQDTRAATQQRGQDRRGSGGRGKAMPTATGPNGEKVQWNGKDWVPAN